MGAWLRRKPREWRTLPACVTGLTSTGKALKAHLADQLDSPAEADTTGVDRVTAAAARLSCIHDFLAAVVGRN